MDRLYQNRKRPDQTGQNAAPEPAAALAAAAASLLSEGGFDAVTVRATANRAGVRPSAVAYWHGDREGLLKAALGQASVTDKEVLGRLAAMFERAAPTLLDASNLLLAAVRQVRLDAWAGTLILWELAGHLREARTARESVRSLVAGRRDFWTRLARAGQLPERAAEAAADVLEWLVRAGLVTSAPALVDGLCQDACLRLVERASGLGPSRTNDSIWRQALIGEAKSAMPPEPDRPEGDVRDRIIEGAVQVLLKGGTSALTHRAIAKTSGASLSSTTYHFATLSEIAEAAYRSMYARILARSRELVDASKGLSVTDMISFQNLGVRTGQGELLAMEQLLLVAARMPSLRPFADSAIARMGEGSTKILQALGDGLPDIDRVDGFLWRLIATGIETGAESEDGDMTLARSRRQQIARATQALFCTHAG